MAQPLELPTTRSQAQPPGESPVHFTYNEKNPEKSQLCDDNRGTCRLVSPEAFRSEYPQEYADFLKHSPQLQARMKEFDKTNPAVLRLPLYELDGMVDGTTAGQKRGVKAGPEEDLQIPLVLDPNFRNKKDGVTIPLRLVDDSLMGPLDRDSSVRQLRIDPAGKRRLDPVGGLQLDPSGSLRLGSDGRLQFDPSRRLEFDANNRLQIRGLGDGSDLRDRSPADLYGRRDLDLRDPFGQRRNGLDALLDPFGRNRNSGLDALLDPLGSRRRDPFGLDSMYGPNSRYGSDRRLRLPGQQSDSDLRLDNYGSVEELNRLYQRGGFEALPPALQKQIVDQLMQGQVKVIEGPVRPTEKPVETPKPVEVPKPVETPKPVEPAKPIDGPKGPTDLETQPTADAPQEITDKAEKPDAFGQAIKDTGAFTIDNFGEAYKEAAKAQAGVAIMVVGRGIPGSEEAIKNIKKLQEENPKLKFLIVDRDKVDAAVKADPNNAKMKEWQSWIDSSIKACGGSETNQVLTSIQSLKADSTGHPAPEKVTSFHWNANINQEVVAKAALASDATRAHTNEFRLTLNAESAKSLNEQIKAAREAALQTPVTDAASMKARQDKFVQALQAASQARPDLLAQRRKEIDALKDEAVKKQELQTLHDLQNAPLLLRAELGLDMVRSVSSLPKQEKQAAMMEAGLQVLRDAYQSAPELKDNQAFAAELKKAGVNVEQLIKDSEKAPRITADQIKQNLERAYSAGDPIRVSEKRTEYTSNLSQGQCERMRCNSGACYSQECIRQKCCTPGGICRRLFRGRR